MIIIGDLISWEFKALLVLLDHLATLDTAVFLLLMGISQQISWISSEVSTFTVVITNNRHCMIDVCTTHIKHKTYDMTGRF